MRPDIFFSVLFADSRACVQLNVVAGLVPATHALGTQKTWMRGTSPRMTATIIRRVGKGANRNADASESSCVAPCPRGRGERERRANAWARRARNRFEVEARFELARLCPPYSAS